MSRHIAFLSDIHGNLTALQAVLSDIQARGITEIYFLGDILGRGPAVHELISLIRTHCKAAVYGNWDVGIPAKPESEGFGSAYYLKQLTPNESSWLLSLPETIELNVEGHSVLCYHGRPSISFSVAPMFNNSTENFEAALTRFGKHDIVIMGDMHRAYIFGDKGRFLCNTGSVGAPTDGVPCASYLILHSDGRSLSFENVRVAYDLSAEVSRALHTPDLPHLQSYITQLATGRYA